MQYIDAHAHVFKTLCGFGADGELRALEGGKAVWATGQVIQLIPPSYGDTSFAAERLLAIMDEHHIEKAVLLQGGFLGFANEYLKQVVTEHPTRFAAAATFDPYCRSAASIIAHLLESFTIFKFEMSTGCGIMGSHEDFALDSTRMMGIYEEIAAHSGTIVFDLGSPGDGSHQPKAVATIARQFPSLPIVICHLTSPRRHHESELIDALKILKSETISFDLAALHHKTRPEAYPFPIAQHFIRLAKDLVGTERLMWGTDAPSTLVANSYQKLLDYQLELFTESEQRAVFYDNAERIYFS
jgi:predicted TIM-barrel fold metal-dependent hydrolase